MTAITFPLKRLPGQSIDDSIHFGGWMLVQPLIMLITTPAPVFFYTQLSTSAEKIYGLIAIVPLIWGYSSMIRYLITEIQVGGLFLLSYKNLRERFQKTRKSWIRNSVMSIMLTTVSLLTGLYHWTLNDSPSILIISLASTVSIQSLVSSFPRGAFSIKRVIYKIGQILILELILIFLANKSLLLPLIIYYIFNLYMMKIYHEELEGYELREMLAKVVA